MLFAAGLPAEIIETDQQERNQDHGSSHTHNMPIIREEEHQFEGQLVIQELDFRGIVPVFGHDSAAGVSQVLGQHQLAGGVRIQGINRVAVQEKEEDEKQAECFPKREEVKAFTKEIRKVLFPAFFASCKEKREVAALIERAKQQLKELLPYYRNA